jgi:3-dehydroquinate synthase
VRIAVPGRPYTVYVGHGLLERTRELLAPQLPKGKLAVVSDSTVARLYLHRLVGGLGGLVSEVPTWTIRPGERSKTVGAARRLWQFLLASGVRRDGCVMALGGGVVGDLAGFAAATFMRGISVVQIPTSLLAQVDAAVGGKTAVNLPRAKNMVGVFHQPAAVVASVDVLRTLSPRHYRSGLAEVVKTAVVGDADLFDLLEERSTDVVARNCDVLGEIVARCCRVKGDIVAADERDLGSREVLNFGHTLGHALEEAAGFRGRTHGEAVAIGMAWAADLSTVLGHCAPAEARRIPAVLRSLGLPTSLRGALPKGLPELMRWDKKARAPGIRVVALESIGSCRVVGPVSEEELHASLERFHSGGAHEP